MLPIPQRLAYGFGREAEDSMYAVHHQMYGKIPGVTSEELVISVALKIEDWLRKGIKLQRDQTDVKVFAVLAREGIVDSNGNWRMARVIARTGAIQALLYKELE